MNLINIDFKNLMLEYKTWENAKKEKLTDKKYNPSFSQLLNEGFLYNTLPYLASIPIIRNENNLLDANKMIESIQGEGEINTPNGRVDKEWLYNLFSWIYYVNRSEFIKNMTKNPTFGSLTPLPMYAMKLHHNIKYNEWDKGCVHLAGFLGRFLKPLLDITEYPKFIHDISEVRKLMLTYGSGKREGQMDKLTAFKANTVYGVDGKPVHSTAARMLAQTWLANSSIRKPGIMILDPIDWENVPEAIDEIKPQVVKPEVKMYNAPWL